jgi:hypothetical protein
MWVTSGSAAFLDVGNEDLAPPDVDGCAIGDRLELAIDEFLQVVGLRHPGDLLEGGYVVAARLEDDFVVVDVDVNGAAVIAMVVLVAHTGFSSSRIHQPLPAASGRLLE